MFQEPLEERYNDLLKQRVALEGKLAISQHQAETELAKAHSKNKRYLFLLILLPLLTFWYNKTQYIKPLEQKTALQQDSIAKLKNEIADIKKVKKDSIRYVIQKGDILVTLGNLFFNDPAFGYQIGLDNGITSKEQQYNLIPGDTLTIHYR
jgi:hypothetical protein